MTNIPRDELPFVAECRALSWRAGFTWLKAGARDLRRTPRLTLVFGLAAFVVSWGVSLLAWWLGRFALLAMLLSGFIFIAPMLAIGLHAVARDLERGQVPSLRRALRQQSRALGQAAVYALILLVVLFTWSRAGMMLYAFFEVERGDPRILAEFLGVGSLIGTGFAALVFASAALSLPMLVDRDADMVTAVLSSVNAVLRNKAAMAVWAACIVALTAVGFATAFVGFVWLMPWLAYSAWHAYRATLVTGLWPELPELPDVA
ncbi:MAG: DUF2189 domain-containing protein [Rhodanobacteraceae bacterium]|jgi:uncharacterized membrane protein|nr:DUF2189 domain-containing protein [Rhodanobacteraceae bacterium]